MRRVQSATLCRREDIGSQWKRSFFCAQGGWRHGCNLVFPHLIDWSTRQEMTQVD